MLVTFTNNSTSTLYLSLIYMQLAPGASAQTRRSIADLDRDEALKNYVLAGTVVLSFTKEVGDDACLGVAPSPLSYSNLTRPVPTTVPVFTWIWNTDDSAPNYSDGTNWRDAEGNIT